MNNIFSWDHRGGRGPWGGRSGGSGGSNGGNKGPQQPRGPQQPDLDDMIRQAQNRLGRMMGGNGGNNGGRGNNDMPTGRLWGLAALGAAAIWLASGFYIVDQAERGVVLRFGEYVATTGPGLNYHLPWPIEAVQTPIVERENRVEIGFRSAGSEPVRFTRSVDGTRQSVSSESLMLTGDENIIDLNFTVRWKVKDAQAFLFNVVDVPGTIKAVAESAMREVIGKQPIDAALTSNRSQIETATLALIQQILDEYGAGVLVTAVELQQVNPPQEVIDAFRDVQAARADAEKLQNDAIGYANDILPRARGQAERILQQARAYKEAQLSKAEGESQRFLSQLAAYNQARDITEKRLYIEAMEDVLQKSNLVVMGADTGRNVLPYLPLANQSKTGGNK